MKKLFIPIIISMLVLSCSVTINSKSLVERNGLVYQVNSQTSFSGKSISYFKNRQIMYEKNWKDGKKDGKWTYYQRNGQIEKEENYVDGKKDGKWIYYQRNGQIKKEENYKDGLEEGRYTSYWENGQIRLEGKFKDGKKMVMLFGITETDRYF